MNNLEISEIVVAKIISQLLENGLEPKTLRESDFGIDKEHLGFVYIPLLPQNPNFFMGYDAEIV